MTDLDERSLALLLWLLQQKEHRLVTHGRLCRTRAGWGGRRCCSRRTAASPAWCTPADCPPCAPSWRSNTHEQWRKVYHKERRLNERYWPTWPWLFLQTLHEADYWRECNFLPWCTSVLDHLGEKRWGKAITSAWLSKGHRKSGPEDVNQRMWVKSGKPMLALL